MDDRRWFVPKLTEEKKPADYWQKLNDWLTLEGGLSAVRQWAEDFLKDNPPVLRGESAPWSGAKKDIIEDSYSPGMQFASSVLDRIKHELTSADERSVKLRERLEKQNMFKDGSAIIVDTDICKLITLKLYEGRANDRLEKPGTIRKVAKARGWHIGSEKIWHYKWGQDRYGGRIISLLPREAGLKPSELGPLAPLDLGIVEGL